ncbi:hypothetical protein ACFS5L_29575 [Streptomyces phyllanthi]|uniref:hypothetical protein n=1 Tax=Streptomyces phyllanthi TaxID=1803180 RepID=UPI0031E8CFA1
MTEAPSGSPWGPHCDDRGVPTTRDPRTPTPPSYGTPPDDPPRLLARTTRKAPLVRAGALPPAAGVHGVAGITTPLRIRARVHLIPRTL